jgi:hypothetical protein
MNNRRDNIQDLSFSGVWDVPLIVKKNSIKQRRDHAVVHHEKIISFLDIDINQLQYLFLDRAETSNFGSLGCNVSCSELVPNNDKQNLGLPSLATASEISWLDARYMFSMSL